MTIDPLRSGSTIGILGGGQLGRMLSVAASRLGFRTHIYEPATNPPAADVAHGVTTADYDNTGALRDFAQSVDVVTFEFENIPTDALDVIEQYTAIRPNREALRVSQDRLTEKRFLQEIGLQVAPFADITDQNELMMVLDTIGTPSILKTRRFGYDGKGQSRLNTSADAERALADIQNAPAILEGFVDFTKEISVIAARNAAKQVVCFDPGENIHKNGILHTTTVPAQISPAMRTDAVLIAAKILNALDYTGVMGVELFVTKSGLVVNEIAPRVHNSGHWTQNACGVDQFEQHIRAIAGLPLGDGNRYADVVMENLIGDDINRATELAAQPDTALHLYGKRETKPGRKMGHVNRIIR